jgi:hypothetical protein
MMMMMMTMMVMMLMMTMMMTTTTMMKMSTTSLMTKKKKTNHTQVLEQLYCWWQCLARPTLYTDLSKHTHTHLYSTDTSGIAEEDTL